VDVQDDQKTTNVTTVTHASDAPRVAVCFVCSGNICRSPIAEAAFRSVVEQAGLGACVDVDSAGTGDWHIGEGADRRAVSVLAAHGLDGRSHRARQFDPSWFDRRDLVIALDHSHLRTLRAWAPHAAARSRIHLLRSFDDEVTAAADPNDRTASLDVPDPYYDGLEAFELVLTMARKASVGLLDVVRVNLARQASGPASGEAPA
jgi:protein-tyrosine phosphatase